MLKGTLKGFDEVDGMVEQMLEHFSEMAEEAFLNQGRFEPWEPSKAARKENRRTLMDTERLFESFRVGSPENILEVVGGRGRFGSRVPYAGKAQTGPPERRIIEYVAEDEDNLKRVMREWAREKIKEAKDDAKL